MIVAEDERNSCCGNAIEIHCCCLASAAVEQGALVWNFFFGSSIDKFRGSGVMKKTDPIARTDCRSTPLLRSATWCAAFKGNEADAFRQRPLFCHFDCSMKSDFFGAGEESVDCGLDFLGGELFEQGENSGASGEIVADTRVNDSIFQSKGVELPHPEVTEPLYRMCVETLFGNPSEKFLCPAVLHPTGVVHVGREGELGFLSASLIAGDEISERIFRHGNVGKFGEHLT